MEIDQETAKKLLVEGATFIFLGVPSETQFGIDLQCWNTEEDFRGIKMIPPGLHYIHYSAVNNKTGDVSCRSGFMHYFQRKEFVVRLWDKKKEDISEDEVSEESIQRLKDNLLQLDRHLAPYPFNILPKWKMLTSQITADLVTKLSPETGIIRSSLELLSVSNEDRPKGVRRSTENATDDQRETEEPKPGQSGTKRKRFTDDEKEDAMLPNLVPVPGASLRYTEIPQNKYPEGSSPGEITKHYLDQSYTLELILQQQVEPLHIIGELQFAYLCFLIGQSLESFEHWKSLVLLFCSCDEAILKHRNIFLQFIKTLKVQIEEMPADFLADIVTNKNIVYKKLREFFRTVYENKVDQVFLKNVENFITCLTETLQWDFSGLDVEEDDEKPVIA